MPLKNFEEHTTHPPSVMSHAPKLMSMVYMHSSDNPLRSDQIEDELGLSGTAVRSIVHAMRIKGHGICSSSKGYWIGNQSEILDTVSSLEQRARSIADVTHGLRRAARLMTNNPEGESNSKMEQVDMFPGRYA